MFTLTDDEKAALDHEIQLRAAMLDASHALRRLMYGTSEEERVSAKAALSAAEKAFAEAQLAETFLIATLKTEANKAIAEKLPGGSYGALLALAEQTLGLVATEGGLRTVNLVKSAALMLLGAGADPDIHLARAQITKARYDALLGVGLPAQPRARDPRRRGRPALVVPAGVGERSEAVMTREKHRGEAGLKPRRGSCCA